MPSFRASDYEFPDLPEDTPILCVIKNIAEVPNRFAKNDEKAHATQLEVNFEIVEGEYKGERIRTWMNPTLGPKANLSKLACAALNVEWSEDLQVDTDKLQNKQVYVIGDYGEDGTSNFLKPHKYRPAAGDGASGGRRRRRQEASSDGKAEPEEKREPVAAGTGKSDDSDLDF